MRSSLKTLIILGILVALLPFFGIPISWKEWIIALLGAAIVVLAVRVRRDMPKEGASEDRVYVENVGRPNREPSADL
jgi:type IV secretory pathway TrbD component